MAEPQPQTLTLTMTHLLSILGGTFSLLGLLVAYLWNLLTERVKKAEGRLDDGASTMHDIKLKAMQLRTDVDHIVISLRNHYESSDEYRKVTTEEIQGIQIDIEHINTRCEERDKKGGH
jgi:hypothetical protein